MGQVSFGVSYFYAFAVVFVFLFLRGFLRLTHLAHCRMVNTVIIIIINTMITMPFIDPQQSCCTLSDIKHNNDKNNDLLWFTNPQQTGLTGARTSSPTTAQLFTASPRGQPPAETTGTPIAPARNPHEQIGGAPPKLMMSSPTTAALQLFSLTLVPQQRSPMWAAATRAAVAGHNNNGRNRRGNIKERHMMEDPSKPRDVSRMSPGDVSQMSPGDHKQEEQQAR